MNDDVQNAIDAAWNIYKAGRKKNTSIYQAKQDKLRTEFEAKVAKLKAGRGVHPGVNINAKPVNVKSEVAE